MWQGVHVVGEIIVVTGTSTGVGKTIATAALAVHLTQTGGSVVVVKPVQTGIPLHSPPGAPIEEADAEVIHRLSGVHTQEFTCLEDPLAPDTAARLRGVSIPALSEHADRIRVLAEFHDYVIVEGAGGLLVRLDTEGGTLLNLATELGATVYVVTSPQLGTLNHTELTVAALRGRGIEPRGLILGSWPSAPALAESCNRDDLPQVTGVPIVLQIPENVGGLSQPDFVAQSAGWWHR
jgi:dethiobiotin synthetase